MKYSITEEWIRKESPQKNTEDYVNFSCGQIIYNLLPCYTLRFLFKTFYLTFVVHSVVLLLGNYNADAEIEFVTY